MWRTICWTVAACVLSAPSALAGDAIGTTKQWGSVDVTLQGHAVRGQLAAVMLLLKNNASQPENISSIAQFKVLTPEGDQSELDWQQSKCNGMIPPMGLFKCKIVVKFEVPVKSLIVQVGAGFEGDPVYFNID